MFMFGKDKKVFDSERYDAMDGEILRYIYVVSGTTVFEYMIDDDNKNPRQTGWRAIFGTRAQAVDAACALAG